MDNLEKLRALFVEVFLISPQEFRTDLKNTDLDTWDSLGVVSLAVGIEETFGYHPKPEEAVAIQSVADVIALLESKGIAFQS